MFEFELKMWSEALFKGTRHKLNVGVWSNHVLCHVKRLSTAYRHKLLQWPLWQHYKLLMTCSLFVFREIWLEFCPSFWWYVTLAPLNASRGLLPIQVLMLMSSCTSPSPVALHAKTLTGFSASSETHPKPLRDMIRLEKGGFPESLFILYCLRISLGNWLCQMCRDM